VSIPASAFAGGPGDDVDLRALALAYLAAHNTVSLATLGPDGPWAATVFYASVEFDLYFLSEPKTRHAQNVLGNPTIAGTINEDYHDWRQIKGIQLTGRCVELAEPLEIQAGLDAYVAKYPFVGQFLAPGRLLEGMAVAGRPLNVRLYQVTPTQVLYLDNERGFSNRQEIPLTA
jgi:uncharacterized protein YhbP (UPF0306 family)